MAERFFVGEDPSDGVFKFRVSKPGYNARSAAPENLLLYETMIPYTPAIQGTVFLQKGIETSGTYASPRTVTIDLGRTFSDAPKIILRNNLNYLPAYLSYWCRLNYATGQLRFYNATLADMTIRYCIFAPIANVNS